jgi:hypothetical protein
MAGLDYAGLLTGISPQSAKIDPFSLPTAGQQRMAFGAQQAQGVQRAGEGLFNLQSQNPVELAKTKLIGLDPSDPEYQNKFIKLLSIADPAKAAEARKQALEQDKKVNQRAALLKMARAQGNESMVTWLEADGDLKTAASVLLKEPKLATAESYATMYDENGNLIKTAVIGGRLHRASEAGWTAVRDTDKLSATDPGKKGKPGKVSLGVKEREKTYDAIISANPDIAKVFTDEGRFWDDIDKNAKTLLLNKAEEIYAANPTLGRENALLQAAEVAPTTTGQPVPTADSFVGKKIKSLKPQ